jgi:O-antigen/teichoic acid export membrane protein
MSERASAVQVARGASYLWIQTLSTTLMQVVAFAFVARLISTSQMGVLAILSLVLGLAQLTAPLALPSAIARFVAEEAAQGRRAGAAAVFYQSTMVSLTLATILGSTCFLLARNISATLSVKPVVFHLLAVDVFLTSGFSQTLANALVGAQKLKDYSLITIAYTAVRQSLIVALLLAFRDFSWLVFAWVISDILYVLMMFVPVVRALGPPTFEYGLRRLLRFSLPLMPGNSVSFAYGWYDRALLVPYASLTELGIYNATLTAFGALSGIPSGIATALYPAYAKIQSVKGRAGLQDAIYVASRYVCFIATPLALGLFATSRPALALFVGEQYEHGSTALEILTLFLALTVLGNAFGSIFMLLGKTATASAATAATVGASFLSALVLLPIWGINGAALSRAVGMLVSLVLTLALARREIRLTFDLEALWKSFAASVGMVATVWLFQYALYDRWLLPAYALAGACTYVVSLRLLKAIHPADVELTKEFLGTKYQHPVDLLLKILQTGP